MLCLGVLCTVSGEQLSCVYDGLEPHNHYEPQQDTNDPNPDYDVSESQIIQSPTTTVGQFVSER
jgi:hypothetical protein